MEPQSMSSRLYGFNNLEVAARLAPVEWVLRG